MPRLFQIVLYCSVADEYGYFKVRDTPTVTTIATAIRLPCVVVV